MTGITHQNKLICAKRVADDKLKNWPSAPNIRIMASTYISPLVNVSGDRASTPPRIILPMPTSGKDGIEGVIRWPCASKISVLFAVRRAEI